MSDYAKGDRVHFLGFGESDPYSRLRVGTTEGTVSIVDDKQDGDRSQTELPSEVTISLVEKPSVYYVGISAQIVGGPRGGSEVSPFRQEPSATLIVS